MTRHYMLVLAQHDKLVMARKMLKIYGGTQRKTG